MKSPEQVQSESLAELAKKELSRRKLKRLVKKHQEDDGEGNWLVSYADLMTLLFGFFVMLQSFSTIDSAKFESLKREATKVFGGEYQVPFEKISKSLKEVVAKLGMSEQVVFTENDKGIDVTFRGALFFDSGSTELKPEAKNLMTQLIPVISETAKDFGIVVEGHTDDSPISTKAIPSNWELSSLRSCEVLRLFETAGFNRSKLKALGWGDTRPIINNRDESGNPIEENRSQNRRVVIKILKEQE